MCLTNWIWSDPHAGKYSVLWPNKSLPLIVKGKHL